MSTAQCKARTGSRAQPNERPHAAPAGRASTVPRGRRGERRGAVRRTRTAQWRRRGPPHLNRGRRRAVAVAPRVAPHGAAQGHSRRARCRHSALRWHSRAAPVPPPPRTSPFSPDRVAAVAAVVGTGSTCWFNVDQLHPQKTVYSRTAPGKNTNNITMDNKHTWPRKKTQTTTLLLPGSLFLQIPFLLMLTSHPTPDGHASARALEQ